MSITTEISADSSPVFADMLKNPGLDGDQTIRLVDDGIERGVTLTAFFNLVYLGTIPVIDDSKDFIPVVKRILSLWRFLNKYDSVAYLRLFRSALGNRIESAPEERFNLLYFVVGAAINDVELSYKAMLNAGQSEVFTTTGGRGAPEELDKAVKYGKYWHLASLPLDLYMMIPKHYTLAYERSIRAIGGTEFEPPRWAAYKFRQLVLDYGEVLREGKPLIQSQASETSTAWSLINLSVVV